MTDKEREILTLLSAVTEVGGIELHSAVRKVDSVNTALVLQCLIEKNFVQVRWRERDKAYAILPAGRAALEAVANG